MFKLNARVVFSVLISLGVIAGIYTSVRAGSGRILLNAGTGSSKVHLIGSANVNLNRYQPSAAELARIEAQADFYSQTGRSGTGHDCTSDWLPIDPDD